MAHSRPWYKRDGQAILMACLSMPDAEHKWAYSAIIDMLNDRDRPITDDAGFICGFTGLSKRKWSAVRDYLLGEGYLVTDGESLTNPRFERERADRQAARELAQETGRRGGLKSAQTRMNFGDKNDENTTRPLKTKDKIQGNPSGNPSNSRENEPNRLSSVYLPKNSPKNAGKTEDKLEINTPRHLKTNDKIQGPPQPTRAREEEERKDNKHTTKVRGSKARENSDPDATRDCLIGDDLDSLTWACTDAAGLSPRAHGLPSVFEQSRKIVQAWIETGVDIRGVAVPSIRAQLPAMDGPAHSLAKFQAQIGKDQAKHNARPRPKAKKEPLAPWFKFDGEAPELENFRRELQKAVPSYGEWCRALRFTFADWRDEGDGQLLTYHATTPGNRQAVQKVEDRHGATIRETAKRVLGSVNAFQASCKPASESKP